MQSGTALASPTLAARARRITLARTVALDTDTNHRWQGSPRPVLPGPQEPRAARRRGSISRRVLNSMF